MPGMPVSSPCPRLCFPTGRRESPGNASVHRVERELAADHDIAPTGRHAPSRLVVNAPMDTGATPGDVLAQLRSGDQRSLDEVASRAYDELRAIAHRRLAAQARGSSMSTTALVHEAYLRLVDQSRAGWNDRVHFLAVAAIAMRHVLVDRARARGSLKRGGDRREVTLDEALLNADDQADTLLQLNEALEKLAAWDPRLARVVDCRFFGGLTEAETAEALGVTVRTVQRDWVKARILLLRALRN
jgi:RNA polymerase sigma factor (TIGR02999 family)